MPIMYIDSYGLGERRRAALMLASPLLAWAPRLAAQASRLWAAYWDWQLRRANVRMLEMLDDRTLKDIGLTRGQIVLLRRRRL